MRWTERIVSVLSRPLQSYFVLLFRSSALDLQRLNSGCLRRGKNTIQIRLWVAKGDIARDRLIEHMVFLQNHADMPPHIAIIQCSEIDVIKED